MPNVVVVGAQWGDEGKGKIVDLLTDRFDLVVRYQGGHNAGHTVWVDQRKIVLHLIPSGIIRPGTRCVIGNGVVVDAEAFWAEVEMLAGMGIDVRGRLLISDRAHLILPCHRFQERIEEARRAGNPIGTTCRGIGPSYEDKAGRRGLRIGDLLEPETFRRRVGDLLDSKRGFDPTSADAPEFSPEVVGRYVERALAMAEFVCDGAVFVNREMDAGSAVLFEGAQGVLLDVDHGTFPFVTSSSASAAGACTGAGVSPKRIDGVIGVAKAYCTRVGSGPFPTELHDAAGDAIRKRGNEYGASTGRPRRCGWFDATAVKYAEVLNRFDVLAVTKLDVLDEFTEIPVCVGYRYKGSTLTDFPADASVLERCEPLYESRPGWCSPTEGISEYEALPQKARDYLRYLEDLVGVEMSVISTGADRHDTILRWGLPGLDRLAGAGSRK